MMRLIRLYFFYRGYMSFRASAIKIWGEINGRYS